MRTFTSKSERIRQIGQELPNARPREIIARLAKKGVRVSSAQVSTVLGSMEKRHRRVEPNRQPDVVISLTLESLLAAKKLVAQLGSVEAAKTAVDALAKLT